ncbi:efflux RND transporter periplasmic adaptor subunit [Paenibacillus tarimensis]
MYKLSNRPSADWKQPVRTAAAVFFALLLLSGCALLPVEEEELQPPLVEPAEETFDTYEVSKSSIQKEFKGVGVFASNKTEPLFYKESGGRIKAIAVELGQEVKKGELIAELETGDLEIQLRQQKLNMERAQIEYRKMRTSDASADDVRLREIALEKENISLEAIEERFARSRLVSPMDGIITYLSEHAPGDSVTAYQPIVSIADPHAVELIYEATNSSELNPIQVNMPATVIYNGQEFPAKVVQTPSSAPFTADRELQERNARKLVIGFDMPPEGIQIGRQATITMPLEQLDDVIVIPRIGLRSYLGRDYVQILEGERRKEVDVEVGLKTSTEVEIRKGLEVGQLVILNN